jgi:hypothetical protein
VVGGRPQGGSAVGRDEVVEPGLVDGRLATVDALDDCLVDVDGGDLVAELRETGAEGGADVSAADDAEVHDCSQGGDGQRRVVAAVSPVVRGAEPWESRSSL